MEADWNVETAKICLPRVNTVCIWIWYSVYSCYHAHQYYPFFVLLFILCVTHNYFLFFYLHRKWHVLTRAGHWTVLSSTTTSPKWWRRTLLHLHRKESTFMACSSRVPAGTRGTASWSNQPTKFSSPHSQLHMSTLSTQSSRQGHAIMPVLSTRNLGEQTSRSSRPSSSRPPSTLTTGCSEELLFSVTQSNYTHRQTLSTAIGLALALVLLTDVDRYIRVCSVIKRFCNFIAISLYTVCM